MPRERRLSVGLGYRSRWGSDFEREPLHVYTEKERERAKELIQQAARQKYGTDMPPVPRVQRTAGVTDGGQAFEGRAMAAPSQKTAPKPKEDKKGGGGLWGKIKAFGGDVLDTLSAASETGAQVLEEVGYGLRQVDPMYHLVNTLSGGSLEDVDDFLHGGRRQRIKERGGFLPERVGELRDPGAFRDKQLNLLRERPAAQQLAIEVGLDPLNLVGAGAAPKIIRAGTALSRGGRAARIAGSVLRGVGRADQALDTAQSKVGRELVGGVAGYTASALAGGDTEQNLRAAGLGALGGNLTRGRGSLPMRAADELARVQGRAGRTPAIGGMIEAENPFLDAYVKTMERHGIEFRYDEYGNVEVLNKEHAQRVADELAQDFMEAITVEVIQGNPAIGNFYGDLRYEYPGDGTKRPIRGDRSRGSHRVERYYEATPELHQDMADAERIFELLDEEKFYDESAEVLRQPWGGKALRGFEPRPAAELAEMERRLEELTAARRTASKEYRELAAEVGKARADRMVADGIAAGLSPQATLTDIAGHIEVLDVHKARMRRLRKGERDPFLMGGEARERVLSLVDTAYKNRLREIAAAIEEMGHELAYTPDDGIARRGVVSEGAVGPAGAGEAPEVAPRGEPTGTEPQSAGATGTVAADTGQYAVGEWVEVAGRRGEVVDVADGQIRVRFENGTEEWVPTQTDLFGDTLTITKVDRPATQARLELEGGSRGQFVPSNQSDFLSGVPESPTGIPEAPQPGQRAMPHAEGERRRAIAAGREPTADQLPRPEVGRGIPEGRPTGGVGGRVEEPTGLPEVPGREPPGPGEPGLGNRQRAFGQDGPGEDLLLGREREALLAEKEAELSQSRNPLRRRKRAEIEIVRDELGRTDHIINEMADQFVERLRARAEAVGLRVERQGEQSVLRGPNGETAMLSDVVEGATPEARAILESLTPEQREIFSAAQAMRDRVNATLEAHGVDVRKVETETGGFWSRRVKGREVEGRIIEKNRAGRSRRLGGDRIGSRTHESAMEGAEEGIIYDDPWEALRAEIRNKLTMAQAEYIAGLIQPLAQPNALAGFGYRPLAMNHPALDKVRFAGTTDSGGVMLGTERPVFPNEIADELDKLFDVRRERDTPSGGVIAAANAVLTPLRASADASFLLNQGMGELVITPQRAPKAIVEGVKVIHSASGNPHAYYSMLEDAASRGTALLREAGIEQDAVEWFTQRGAHYAGAGGPDDFQFPQKFEEALRRIPGVGKVPADVVRWSNETFARYLNLKRVNLNNDALERLVKQGLRGEELDKAMRAAIRANNRATGWTGTKAAGWQELALFAPRYFKSNIEQVVNAVSKGGMEGSIARRHLLGLLGYATVITYAINAARGYNTSVDPRDHNFLRIRNVGGHDISVLGPFASLIRAGAQAVGGRADMTDIEQRGRGLVWGRNAPKPEPFEAAKTFARAKASPVFSTAWSYITAATFDGKPIERDPTKPEFYTRTLAELGKESLPFSVQAALEEGPLAAATSAVGLQGSPMTPVERRNFARDEVARELFGVPYGELESAEQRAQVNMDERVARWHQESLERRMEGGGDDARRAESDIEFRAKMEANGRFLRQGEDDAGNLFSGNDYRKAYHDAVLFRRGQLSQLEGESGDPDIEGYFGLYDQATMPNGQVDYDLLEQLQAEYLEENPGVQAKIDKFIGVYDDPVMQEFRRAQQQAREYYQIPAYRGMTLEDSRRATEVLNLVNAYVAAGEAANRRHAYQLVVARGLVTEDDVRLAIEAVKRGSNPERKKFRTEHAEFRKFYTDAAGIEGTGEFATAPQRVYGVAGRGRASSLVRGRPGGRRGLSSGLGRRR